MKIKYNFLDILNLYIKDKIIINTIKLNLLISILFLIFTSNCIAMVGSTDPSTSSSDSVIVKKIPWDKYTEIQDIIHNKYENTQFEVKQQPIPIYKLSQIILSFINGESSPAYIVIGIKEEKEKYDFNIVLTKPNGEKEPDGIYGIISNDKKSIECYQVKNGKIVLLQLNHISSDLKKSNQYLKKNLNAYDKKKLSSEEASKYFTNFVGNPINSNYIKHVELPIKIEDNKTNVIYETVDSYIKAVKTYIEKNSVHNTVRTINLDRHISHEYIKPYNNEESKIIIIKITPWNSKLIALKSQGDKFERVYARIPKEGQLDFNSDLLSSTEKSKRQKERLKKRKSKFSNEAGGPSLNFMDLLDYMGEENLNAEDVEKFKKIFESNSQKLGSITDPGGNNLLMLAILCKQESFAKFLLGDNPEGKIKINNNNDKNKEILLMATLNDYIDIVKLLIEKDPNIMQNTENWKPAFIQACKNKKWEIAKYFLNNFKPKKFEPKEGERKKQRYKVQVKCFLEDLLDSIEELKDDSYNRKEIKNLIDSQLLEY